MPFGIHFHSGPFIHTWASRRATRNLKKLLDGIGHERLAWAVEHDRPFTAFFPPELVNSTVLKNPIPREFLKEFPDSEVYGWVPTEYRSYVEGLKGGSEWIIQQIDLIRKLVVTT
jgi:hypothetical protein